MKRIWTLALTALLTLPSAARADRIWSLGLGMGPVGFTRDQHDLFDGSISYGAYGEIEALSGFGFRAELGHASFDGTEAYDATVSSRVGSPVTNRLSATSVLGDVLYRVPVPSDWSARSIDVYPTLYAGVGSYMIHRSRDSALPEREAPAGAGDDTRQTKLGFNVGVGVEFETRADVSLTALYRYHFLLTDPDAFQPSGLGTADDRTDYQEGVFGVKVYFGPGGIQSRSGD